MASKPRQKRPRAIPPQYATWSEHEDAAAKASDQYVADLDGDAPHMHWVIRRRETGKMVKHWPIIEDCPTATKSEVEDRVALLNRGKPTRADNQSWGKLTKERARPGKGVKSADSTELSATEWVERLVGDPEISVLLREYVSDNRAITLDELVDLLHEGSRLKRL